MGHSPVNGRALPLGLGAVCIIPAAFGLYRAAEIIGRPDWVPRLAADQVDALPLLLHILGSLGFLVFGAIQILPGTRHRHRRWHRKAGRFVAPLGLLGALSGLWMTLAHPQIGSDLLYWGRLAASGAWAAFILMSLSSLRSGDFADHGRWMIRAYALAMPAGTLAFILLPIVLVIGEDSAAPLTDIIQVAAWPAHLAVAEWLMARRRRHQPKLATVH